MKHPVHGAITAAFGARGDHDQGEGGKAKQWTATDREIS